MKKRRDYGDEDGGWILLAVFFFAALLAMALLRASW